MARAGVVESGCAVGGDTALAAGPSSNAPPRKSAAPQTARRTPRPGGPWRALASWRAVAQSAETPLWPLGQALTLHRGKAPPRRLHGALQDLADHGARWRRGERLRSRRRHRFGRWAKL